MSPRPRSLSEIRKAMSIDSAPPAEKVDPEFRIEHDSMGPIKVPRQAYYGAQTQRAVENFPVSGWQLPPAMIRALGLVKFACASANRDLGKLAGSGKNPLNERQIESLLAAAREVIDGRWNDQFPIDVFQTGSGTSSNMNVNEVIANRAIELDGGDRFDEEKAIHPNDHVNMGQSTNDTFPTAIHVAVGSEIKHALVPALDRLSRALHKKADAWQRLIKIGRTHLMDATPLTLGQEFSGFARQIDLSLERADQALEAVGELPVGGTAVGTGINTHPEFGNRVASILADETGIPFIEAVNHFEANAQRDGLVACHGHLNTVAATLFNLANNIRWLGSGPRCALFEVQLPSRQPGSSIMPGKVNPVMCESMMQVTARVMGNNQAITLSGAAGGQFQLNIMMPMMAHTMLESIALLTGSINAFVDFCVTEMQANQKQAESFVEQSLSMITSLNPYIGYEMASELAKEAFATGKTIRELCREKNILPEDTLREALNPMRMTKPQE